MNPAQAASTSMAGPTSPSRSCTRQAVEGNDMSGVNVPRTSRSQSFAVRPVLAKQSLAASTHRSLVAWCGQGVAALEDAGPLDDPVGVEPEPGVQVVVGDDAVGDVLAGADDPDPHQGPAPRSGGRSFAAHRCATRCRPGAPDVGRTGGVIIGSGRREGGVTRSCKTGNPRPPAHSWVTSAPLWRNARCAVTRWAVASIRTVPSVGVRWTPPVRNRARNPFSK